MSHSHAHYHNNGLLLEPYATSLCFTANKEISKSIWEDIIRNYAILLSRHCSSKSEYLIGHIKGYAQLDDKTYLRFSAVAADIAPDVVLMGDFSKQQASLNLDLNAHVYGLSLNKMQQFIQQTKKEIEGQYQDINLSVGFTNT